MKTVCDKIKEQIAENGALILADDADFARHVAGCPECKQFLKAATELDQMFSALGELDAPELSVSKVLQTVGSLGEVQMDQVDVSQSEEEKVSRPKAKIEPKWKPTPNMVPWYRSRYFLNGVSVVATATFLGVFYLRTYQEIYFGDVVPNETSTFPTSGNSAAVLVPTDDKLGESRPSTFEALTSSVTRALAGKEDSPTRTEQLKSEVLASASSANEKDKSGVRRNDLPNGRLLTAPGSAAVFSAPRPAELEKQSLLDKIRESEKKRMGVGAQSADSAEEISAVDSKGYAEGVSLLNLPPSSIVGAKPDHGAIDADSNRRISSVGTLTYQTEGASAERYGTYEENPRVLTVQQPLSTFSIDVDTGSYTNTRRFLQGGQLPPPSSVRIEEYLNYFTYNYPSANDGKPFTFHYEIAPSPLQRDRHLLKLGIKATHPSAVNEDKGWNLVFLVDVSGSMSDANKLPLLKESLKSLVAKMRAQDRVAIVTYAGETGVALESTSGTNKEQIISVIDGLGAGGSTNGAGGIEAAYRVALANRLNDGVNRVILATDGDFNVGVTSFDALVQMVEEKRKSGITLTTLGFGGGNYNEQNLEQLANKGNGNYFYVDSLEEGRKILGTNLTGNMEVVAKDVKLQIEFNPALVKAYRLIGYDNRKLRNQDFDNDAIDAGEIGAGHTVTALYEVILAGSPLGSELQGDSHFQKVQPSVVEAGAANEFAFLKIRYKEPNGDTSKLLEFPLAKGAIQKSAADSSADFRFAAAVAGFGTILRHSQYLESNTNLVAVRELASSALNGDELGERREFLSLIDRAMGTQGRFRGDE